MLIEEAVGKILSEHPGVAALVAARIYSPNAPQGLPSGQQEFPLVVFRVTGRNTEELLAPRAAEINTPTGSAGLAQTRFRVFSSNKTRSGYAVAKRLDLQVNLALVSFQGTLVANSSPIDTIEIQGVTQLFTMDMPDDKTETISVVSDFEIWHSIPTND